MKVIINRYYDESKYTEDIIGDFGLFHSLKNLHTWALLFHTI